MSLFLEIMDGENKGTKIPLRDGLVIGRREADVILNDSKISGKHAKVEFRANGKAYLIDLGSSNGIKLAGNRAREVELLEGLEFVLGRTPIRVLKAKSSAKPNVLAEPSPEIVIEPEETSEKPPKEPAVETWVDFLQPLIQRAKKDARGSLREIAPFAPVLRLRFVRGVQTGTEWTIGYGPREVGGASIDLMLEETGLPSVCFRLLPHHEGVLLRTEASTEIRINGKSADAQFLRDGDVIEIKNTQIEVEFETN